jgi:hypothetical protein
VAREKDMSYRCSICGEEYDAIPPDALPVGTQKYSNLTLMFPAEGRIHNLKLVRIKKPKELKEVKDENSY